MVSSYNSVSIRIERLSDKDVYNRLGEIASINSLSGVKFKVVPIFTNNDLSNEETSDVVKSDSISLKRISISSNDGITVNVNRSLDTPDTTWAAYDTVVIQVGNGNVPVKTVVSAITSVRSLFTPLDQRTVLDHLTDDQKAYVLQRQASLHRLESLQDEFFRKISSFTVEQANAAQTNQIKLEEVFQKRAKELESQYTELRRKLDEERREFEDRKKEIDLRDSTVVRRSIRDEVKKLLVDRKDGFALSKIAQSKQTPVLVAYVALLAIFGGLAVRFITNDFSATISDTPSPWLIGRQIAFTISFAVTAGFFIRWLNSSAQRHADEEFQTRKYELDFERASFVVEWAMEWSKDQKEVPQFLIERLSRGLFDLPASTVESATAADAVASALFGSAASAKLKLGDNEITLDRKGIRNLKTEA